MLEVYNNYVTVFFENKIVQSALVFLVAFILVKILKKLVRSKLTKTIVNSDKENAQRNKTLLSVASATITVLIYFFAVLSVLQVLFNVQPSSIIAATGIVSVAVGFGAQSIVKDSINGFFILAENQYAVGDVVSIENFKGTVYEITLRITKVRDASGDMLIIPNGMIDMVINHSKSNRNVFVEIAVSYNADVEKAIGVLKKAGAEMYGQSEGLIEPPDILGVSKLGGAGVYIKTMLTCTDNAQFTLEREFLKRAYLALKENNIEIPYNPIADMGAVK